MPQITGSLINFYTAAFKTDFGWLRAISDGNNLIKLEWNQHGWQELDNSDCVSRETTFQLKAYFTGKLCQFTLPLAPFAKTASGKSWLDTMSSIPYGTTVSYAKLAYLTGKPGATRAAGSACAKNPIPIIYPCHRVIRADQTLGNYSGGTGYPSAHRTNLALKASLLQLELSQLSGFT